MFNLTELQKLASEADVAFFVKKVGGKYLIANEQASALIGLAGQSVVNKTDEDLFDPKSAELIIARDREISRSICPIRTYDSLARAQGRWGLFATTKLLLPTNIGPVLVGLSTDVSLNRCAPQYARFCELTDWVWSAGLPTRALPAPAELPVFSALFAPQACV